MRRITLIVIASLMIAATAHAEFKKGDFELSLTGSGVTPADGDSFTTAVSGGLGYLLTDAIELSLRQSIGYSDVGEASSLFNTSVAGDYNYALNDKFTIFGGAFVGMNYGDIAATWIGGPEVGVKYWLSESTILVVSANYGFPFEGGDGQFVYSLGINFRF